VRQVVRPPTLTAMVVEALRDAIFRGEMQPGDPLREVDLAASMNVSRGTIREALRQLQDDGLVEVIPHRGAYVTELTPRIAREVYTLRGLLEPYAVRRAMEEGAYCPDDLGEMERLALRLAELDALGNPTYESVKADVEFHRLICSRSNHDLLCHILSGLRSRTWLFVFNVRFHQWDTLPDDPAHYAIFEAIRSGDPDQAEEALRRHILVNGAALLRLLEDRS
jgi:DNA-binding GntR family transcriptional regulator